MIRIAIAILAALVFSQFPSFSQQYVQRLGGAAEELQVIIKEFDASAARAEMTREEALDAIEGNAFLSEHQESMRNVVERGEKLSIDFAALAPLDDISRLWKFYHIRDPKLIQETAASFRPALPLTIAGLIIAGIGFAVGYVISWSTGRAIEGRRRRRDRRRELDRIGVS